MMRSIAQIDSDITANLKALRARRRIKHTLSTADWQAAWDKEPALSERHAALYAERGNAQAERGRSEYEAAMKMRPTVTRRRKAA